MDPNSSETLPILPASTPSLFQTLWRQTFRSLHGRNYRLYFFGQIVSFTGSWMQSAALMWLVFEATNDPMWPPLMLVATVGPTLILGTFGGALADRLPKRKLVIVTQSGFLLTSIMLAIFVSAGMVSPWLLLGVNFTNGLIQSVDLPARLAFVPELVSREDLINAVSLNSLLFNSARAVGPALAGGLFLLADAATSIWPMIRPVALGAFGCFIFNSVSYLAVLAALRRIDVEGYTSATANHGSVWDGFRYVRQRRSLAWLIAIAGFLCVFGWPALTLFPAYTRQVLGHAEKEYSLLVTGLGGGALVAALLMATFGSAHRRGLFFTTGGLATAVGLFGLANAEHLFTAIIAAALGGFGLILFLSTGQSTLQQSAAPASRGRVMALWAMMLSGSAPIGHLLAGAAAQRYPIPDVLLVLAAGAATCAVAATVVYTTVGWNADAIEHR